MASRAMAATRFQFGRTFLQYPHLCADLLTREAQCGQYLLRAARPLWPAPLPASAPPPLIAI